MVRKASPDDEPDVKEAFTVLISLGSSMSQSIGKWSIPTRTLRRNLEQNTQQIYVVGPQDVRQHFLPLSQHYWYPIIYLGGTDLDRGIQALHKGEHLVSFEPQVDAQGVRVDRTMDLTTLGRHWVPLL
jgi:hypothetical protein